MSTQPASSRSCWRSAIKRLFAIAAATTLMSGAALADSVVLDPASDGSLYVCAGCNVVSDDAYVLVSGYIQGAIKFSSSALAGRPVSQAFLTLNPYGLPLWDLSLDVYGYGTAEGALVEADADAGTFLGTWILPFDLGYGEDALFDVTSFLTSVSDPYIAFNLRSDDTDVFSSLEYNYGHPSQLLVTFASPVPEPAGWTVIVASVLLLVALRRAKAPSPGPSPSLRYEPTGARQ